MHVLNFRILDTVQFSYVVQAHLNAHQRERWRKSSSWSEKRLLKRNLMRRKRRIRRQFQGQIPPVTLTWQYPMNMSLSTLEVTRNGDRTQRRSGTHGPAGHLLVGDLNLTTEHTGIQTPHTTSTTPMTGMHTMQEWGSSWARVTYQHLPGLLHLHLFQALPGPEVSWVIPLWDPVQVWWPFSFTGPQLVNFPRFRLGWRQQQQKKGKVLWR